MSLETPLKPHTPPLSTKNHNMSSSQTPNSDEIIDVEAFQPSPIGATRSTAITVEDYVVVSDRDLDLELAIAASLGHPLPSAAVIDLSDDDVKILDSKPESTTFGKKRRRIGERGESSGCAPYVCEICAETKTRKDEFFIAGCSHSCCAECVARYVGSKLQENVTVIPCPMKATTGCGGSLTAEGCRGVLPSDVYERWGQALCEAVISAEQKFYCPYKDCSALMVDDGREVVSKSECPNCRRLFCARCKVPWHSEIDCEAFQKLNEGEREREDILLLKLADEKHWRRCPNCKVMVEKTVGCMYIKCRCGNDFCYNCGARPKNHSHYCYNCKL